MRFHMGVSFRLKTLKKFIWPVLIGLLAYFLGSGVITARAESSGNYQTYVDVSTMTHCGKPLQEYLDFFIGHTSDLYHDIVTYNNGVVSITFVPNFFDSLHMSTLGYDNPYSLTNYLAFNETPLSSDDSNLLYNSGFTFSFVENKCNNIDILDNVNAMRDFTDYMEEYQSISNYAPNPLFSNFNASNVVATKLYSASDYVPLFTNNVNGVSIASIQSYYYTIDSQYSDQYVLYTDFPVYFTNTPYNIYSEPGFMYDYININGRNYNVGDVITWDYISDEGFNESYNNLPDSYLYFNKSNIDNLGFKLQFFSPDFMNNNNIRYMLSRASGRIKNGDTYYYEPINCTINLSKASFSESNGTITFTLNGLTCSSDLTPYDYISANVVFYRNDDNILESFSHIKSSFTNGIEYLYFGGEHLGVVYQPLRNISGNFIGFISSNNNYSNILTIKSDNSWIYTQPYKLSTMSLVNPTYNEYLGSTQPYDLVYQSYGLGIDQGILFSLDDQHRVNSVDMDLFFDNYTYLYLSESNTTQVCYYYNESYQCSNITINYDYSGSDSNDYDVSNYFGLVTDFIDSISSDMVNFGGLVQQVYNTIPPFISSFFVVLYILGNAFLVYKLINRR